MFEERIDRLGREIEALEERVDRLGKRLEALEAHFTFLLNTTYRLRRRLRRAERALKAGNTDEALKWLAKCEEDIDTICELLETW